MATVDVNTDRLAAAAAKVNLTNTIAALEWERVQQLAEAEAARKLADDQQAAVDADAHEKNAARITARIEVYEARLKVVEQAGKVPAK